MHCSKFKGPDRSHIGLHRTLCRHPSPQFINDMDVPELVNIHHNIKASIRARQDQINNLTVELEMLNLRSSTSLPMASMPQQHFDRVPVITSIPTHAPSTTWSAGVGVSCPSTLQVPVPLATSFSTTTTTSLASLSHPGTVGFPLSLDSKNKN